MLDLMHTYMSMNPSVRIINLKWLLICGALSLILVSLTWNIIDDYAAIFSKCHTGQISYTAASVDANIDLNKEPALAKGGAPFIDVVPSMSPNEACRGRQIYIYPLPPQFNEEILNRCRTGYPHYCHKWPCLPCNFLENNGFGSKVVPITTTLDHPDVDEDLIQLVPPHAWYRTNQFSLEVIFHEKLKSYECRTHHAASADAFYIPFFAGLDLAFTLFSPHLHLRDELTQQLIGWLSANEVWQQRKHDACHFMPLGRIAWDFNRDPFDGGPVKWGSSLLLQPPLANITTLVFERKFQRNPELGVPYPTLFHPSSDDELDEWRAALTEHKRRWLVTFVGASNRSFDTEVVREIRVKLVAQCREGRREEKCRVVECGGSGSPRGAGDAARAECEREPEAVVRALAESVFCLQPRGDSATRKGFFDAIVAGCIPVVFSSQTASAQYPYHLAHRSAENGPFSVFIPEHLVLRGDVNVVHALSLIPAEQVRALQRSVLRVIPDVVYYSGERDAGRSPDAFSIALDALFAKLPPPPPIYGMNIPN